METSAAPLGRDFKWINIIFLVTTAALAVAFVPWYLWTHTVSWKLYTLLGIHCVLTSMSITLGYHRLFAHRAFEARTWVQLVTLFFGAGAFQGSAIEWGTDHRKHHRFIDQDEDPYNIQKGFWWAHIGWLFYDHPKDVKIEYAPDLQKNPLVLFQHRHFVSIAVTAGFLIPWFEGWLLGEPLGGLLLVGLLRQVFTQHCTFLINSACHCIGRKPYNDRISARDNLFLAILTYGEGYHNFHHHFQADYRNGVRWYEWDPTKWAIRVLEWTGSTRKLKRVQPIEILKARLHNDESRLLKRGIPAEKLEALKLQVMEAQLRFRQLQQDYRRLKESVTESSRAQLVNLKAEMRMARVQFRRSFQLWRVYYRTMRTLPVLG